MKTGLILKKVGIILIVIVLVSIFIFYKSNETRGREAYKNMQYYSAVEYLEKAIAGTSDKQKKIELYNMLADSYKLSAITRGGMNSFDKQILDIYEKKWDLDNTNQKTLENIVEMRMSLNVSDYGTGEVADKFMEVTDKYLQTGLQKFPDSNVFTSYDKQKKEATEGMKKIFDAMMKEGKLGN